MVISGSMIAVSASLALLGLSMDNRDYYNRVKLSIDNEVDLFKLQMEKISNNFRTATIKREEDFSSAQVNMANTDAISSYALSQSAKRQAMKVGNDAKRAEIEYSFSTANFTNFLTGISLDMDSKRKQNIFELAKIGSFVGFGVANFKTPKTPKSSLPPTPIKKPIGF